MAILDLDLAVAVSNSSNSPRRHASAPSQQADDPQPRLQGHQGKASSNDDDDDDVVLLKGVRHLCERGSIRRLPARYVLPPSDRPVSSSSRQQLPVIDLVRLRRVPAAEAEVEAEERRGAALAELDAACREYGFFQVVNHGVDAEAMRGMLEVARRFFFDLPLAERERYMSSDILAPVRYGTSFNQLNDGVLCWRDFLKIVACNNLADDSSWPHAPKDLREVVSAYARSTQRLFRELMEAALEALGIRRGGGGAEEMLEDCDRGSQMVVVNCFPACPEPDLTLGMPPHSDYGFLTILLQDQVKGLEVRHADSWVLVDPLPGALLVNIGDHFEIYSNGRYKSVLHRVRVNSSRSRISVASLHSLPPERVIGPAAELVDEERGSPRRYMDTDFATFLNYLTSAEGNQKTFLQSRTIITSSTHPPQ